MNGKLLSGLGFLDPRGNGASREGPGACPAGGWGTEVLGMRDMGKEDMRRTEAEGVTTAEDPLLHAVFLSHPRGGFEHSLHCAPREPSQAGLGTP